MIRGLIKKKTMFFNFYVNLQEKIAQHACTDDYMVYKMNYMRSEISFR